MKINKNDRVRMKGNKVCGTAMSDSVTKWSGYTNERYVNVLFDGEEYEVSVRVDSLEVV